MENTGVALRITAIAAADTPSEARLGLDIRAVIDAEGTIAPAQPLG
jgi:hypothetical protein